MITFEEVFKIGKLGHPHGLRGEIDFYFTDDVFDRMDADFLVCCIDGLLVPFFLEGWRFRGHDCAIVKFVDLDTEQSVRIVQNAEVYFPKSLASDREEEISSWNTLTGFSVADTNAGNLGTVVNVDQSSANILLEIETPDKGDLLLPIHPDLVAEIDVRGRAITLALPEGLLSL